MTVEAIEVPPGAVVVRRSSPVLHYDELCKIAKDMIEERTVPVITLLVDGDTLVWRAKRVKNIDVEVWTCFNDRARDEATLRDTKQIYLFASVVRIIVKLVAHYVGLPLHAHKL